MYCCVVKKIHLTEIHFSFNLATWNLEQMFLFIITLVQLNTVQLCLIDINCMEACEKDLWCWLRSRLNSLSGLLLSPRVLLASFFLLQVSGLEGNSLLSSTCVWASYEGTQKLYSSYDDAAINKKNISIPCFYSERNKSI